MPTEVNARTPFDSQALRSVTFWPVGDGIRVAAMSDGYFETAMDETVRRFDAEEAERLHHRRGGRLPPRITHMNYALMAPQGPITLVDAGMGSDLGDSLGHLPVALDSAGIAADDVGLVLLTHLHLDHSAGLLGPDGAPAFPRATVVIEPAEIAHWTDPHERRRAGEDLIPWFDGATRVVDAYRGQIATPGDLPDVTPLPITPLAMAGHTPGHTGYRVQTAEHSVTFVGDLVHMPSVQGPSPEACMVFDVDPETAATTRRRFFATVAGTGEVLAGGHTDYPGFVTVDSPDGVHFVLRPALWVDHL